MEILKKLREYLISNKFKPEADEKTFVLERKFQVPGQRITINGQVVQQPGQELIRTVTVEFFGPGYVRGNDETEEPFEEVRIKVEELIAGGKSGNIQEFVEGLYDEDFDRIKGLLEKIIQ